MTMRFRYKVVRGRSPILSLGGRTSRSRPVIPVTLIGPGGTVVREGLLDSGADDTVFPENLAPSLGLNLTNAPHGYGGGVGSGKLLLRFAEVTFRLAQGGELREWRAWVGFTSATFLYPMLGCAGFLQFFDVNFLGAREEVELTVNNLYPGT
jgi:hypothetical protein